MADDPGTGPPPSAAASAPAASREQVIGEGVTWLSRWTLRWLVIALGAVALGFVVRETWSILLPLLLAMILTTVLEPPARWLERKAHAPRTVAALVVVVGAVVLAMLLLLVLVPSVGNQAGDLANKASDGLDQVRRWLLDSKFGVSQQQVDDAVQGAQSRLRSSASAIASGLLTGVSAVTQALVNLVLTLVLSFFFLKDGHRFLPWLGSITGERAGGHLGELGRRMWGTLGGFVRTQALVGLIDAVLIGLGLVVVGVPLALPLAVLTFFAAFAPVVGAVTVGALAALVALVANGFVAAVIVVVIVLVVQQLEGNLFLPWLQGKSLGLHAGVVLLTIVLGATLFGVAGAFLGVPAVAVLAVVLRYLGEVTDARTGAGPGPAVAEEADAG